MPMPFYIPQKTEKYTVKKSVPPDKEISQGKKKGKSNHMEMARMPVIGLPVPLPFHFPKKKPTVTKDLAKDKEKCSHRKKAGKTKLMETALVPPVTGKVPRSRKEIFQRKKKSKAKQHVQADGDRRRLVQGAHVDWSHVSLL